MRTSNRHTKKEIIAMGTPKLLITMLAYGTSYFNRGTKADRKCLEWMLSEILTRTRTVHTDHDVARIIDEF